MTNNFDLVVLGGGPAGISAAASAGFLGKRVALVERLLLLGGAGINTGTIPSKTLRETALVLSGLKSRELHGVDLSLRGGATVADFGRHARTVTDAERDRSAARLELRGVTRFRGTASFVDPHTIRVLADDGGETVLHGERILIATGSSPVRPSNLPFDDPRVHDSDEILAITELPRAIVVIGAGVIGSEYACTFAAIGAQVHLVDGRDTLMPFLDREISQALAAAMGEGGVRFHWNERVVACDASQPGDLVVTLTSGTELRCDALLVGAGRQSNTEQLNLAAAGIVPGERGLVPVYAHYRSRVPHIYAVGDVIGAPALASTGIEQARVAVAHAFGSAFKSDLATCLPSGVYTIPEASMAGQTEAALVRDGIDYVAGRARYADLPRGEIIGDRAGFLKLLFRREDMRLLGVHIMGEQATELVHVGLMALLMEADVELFNRACFNYPTLGDLYKYAAYDAIAQREALADAG